MSLNGSGVGEFVPLRCPQNPVDPYTKTSGMNAGGCGRPNSFDYYTS